QERTSAAAWQKSMNGRLGRVRRIIEVQNVSLLLKWATLYITCHQFVIMPRAHSGASTSPSPGSRRFPPESGFFQPAAPANPERGTCPLISPRLVYSHGRNQYRPRGQALR